MSNPEALRTYNVSSFSELRDLIEEEISDIGDYVFRRQSNASWELTSTLDRLIKHARKTGAKHGPVDDFVQSHLDRFRLEIRGRRGNSPPKLEENELWALGQHFGLATPLLDWSRSPYISIFFALGSIEDDQNERVLWCLHKERVEKINAGLSQKERLELIFPDSDDNKRLLGQSGLFSKGPVMRSVDEWVLKKSRDIYDPVLIKIVFPGDFDFRRSALKKLELMNINYSTLFPDLMGASLYCNNVAEDYRP
ncbi:MAG: FRG domain-containing protein [Bacteroidota bacterium]